MPLDVHIVDGDGSHARGPARLQFQDDGYFWYLYDAFRDVANRTGQMVGLYDDASFVGDQIVEFENVLLEWRARIEACPSRWSVTTGFEIQHEGRKTLRRLDDTVESGQMLRIINDLLALLAEARVKNVGLCFVGD